MKKSSEVFNIEEEIKKIEHYGAKKWLYERLVKAYYEARMGKLKTHDEHAFEINYVENLRMLREAIMGEWYEPGPSKAFVIFQPMIREIFAARFRDRVVHHLLAQMQAGWWDKRFIYDSFACRKGKGTLFGINQTQKMMQAAISEAGERAVAMGRPRSDWRQDDLCPRIIKLDISGYFMSLPRAKVFGQIKWGLEQQFGPYMDNAAGFWMYKMCEFLWKQIIFDDPVAKAVKRGDSRNWDPEVLPPRKSLFCQPPGVGLVIGNYTSQLCSNVYLNQLDRWMVHGKGYKRYGRYVDDFYIIVQGGEEYERAKKDVVEIEEFLKEELLLTLHPDKRYIQQVYKGMEFIGARIYPYCKYPSDRLQSRFKDAAWRMAHGDNTVESIVSYLGLMCHLDVGTYLKWFEDEYGWVMRVG